MLRLAGKKRSGIGVGIKVMRLKDKGGKVNVLTVFYSG
jgi:hypothetical protein